MATASHENYKLGRDEALAWFVRINSGETTEAELSAFAAWMAASPDHYAEYRKLSQIWSDLDRIPDPRIAPTSARQRTISRRAFLGAGGAALGMAAYVAVAGLPDFIASDFATGTGEMRSVALPDGTTVDLDADSAISLNFTSTSRDLVLRRGRAFFDVAADVLRPFSVLAGNGSVNALGTRFVVHKWADTVLVSVEESAVSVQVPGNTKAVVQAGSAISYDRNGIGELHAVELDSEAAWRRGKLIFQDRPLSQVVADVNRYRSGTIRVLDQRLLNMRISGIFDITNPDAVLDAIRSTLPVEVVEFTPYFVLLRPA